ncbi:MAG: protein adenylyltransferase SelO family protein, partial [Pseudomonadota bacterium]
MHADLFEFDNSYAEKLSGFYVDWKAAKVPEPKLICFNRELAEQLGLELSKTDEKHLAQIFAGNEVPTGAHTLAQVYAGHQFGGFSPQLGDGRALLIGETLGKDGVRRDIQLKGSGPTPFSRNGDGKAAIGPVLREYLMAEAMHALGIPTTRALAAVTTGEEVFREAPLPGAILTRVASSHVRVGTFQFFASRGDMEKVQQLADYVIWRHYPELAESDTKYVDLLKSVSDKQAKLIALWMTNGFIHGVMNTDNMTLSGETIDYGPCA